MKQTVFSIDLVAENGENFKQDCPFDFDTKEESRDAGNTCNPSETTIIAQETPTNSNCDINPVLQRSISSRSHYSNTLSTGRTLLYLIKGNLGAGLFAIPAAFKDAGLVGGSIGVPLMALLSIHCMHMLVKCTEVLKSRCGDPDMAMDYSQVIETACLTGPQKMAKFATIAKRTIKISCFIKEVAFCSVFILFAGYYLRQLVSYFYPELEWTVRYWTAVMSIPALAMACIRNHEHLHTLSYLASSIKAISLVVLFVYIFKDDLPHISERPAFSVAAHLLLYYGTVIFAFEGVTQVLPLHDNMRTTRHFRKWNGVLNTGMVLIGCLYFTLGFYGYLKYGEATYPSITMNLPKDEIACQIVKIGLIVALLINYGNQLHAAYEITEPTIDRHCKKKGIRLFTKIGIRALIFITSVLVALITENLELLMSLTGALTCTFLCLLFPPTLDIITFWNYMGWFRLAKNIFIILLSFAAFASGTFAAVMAFENYFVKEDFLYGDRATT